MIDGVKITKLEQILDERGKIMPMMRSDSKIFKKFGEIYFSCIYPGAVKAWHLHKKMILNYAVPFGNIKFVLYDARNNSTTYGKIQEIYLGTDNCYLVTVPPLIWNGFKCIGTQTAIVANCSSIPHDPREMIRLDPFTKKISYNWLIKHG